MADGALQVAMTPFWSTSVATETSSSPAVVVVTEGIVIEDPELDPLLATSIGSEESTPR